MYSGPCDEQPPQTSGLALQAAAHDRDIPIINNKAVIIRIFVRQGKVIASSHNIINSQTIPNFRKFILEQF